MSSIKKYGTLVLFLTFNFAVYSQDFTPKMYNDTLIFKLDTFFTPFQKIRLKKFDDMYMRLVKWQNGLWEVAMHNKDFPETIYVPDKVFIQDDPSYRTELGKYSAKANKANKVYLAQLIRKYGRDKGFDYYYKQPFVGLNSSTVLWFLGNPDKINRTETRYGVAEQWVYYRGATGSIVDYYYFKNGVLEAMQN